MQQKQDQSVSLVDLEDSCFLVFFAGWLAVHVETKGCQAAANFGRDFRERVSRCLFSPLVE